MHWRTRLNGRRAFVRFAVCLLLAGAPDGCAGAAFTALYAFGDSLTDTGREPAESHLHYQGRWSNGPLWVEYLSEKLGLAYSPANNYAHSGAQTDDTLKQIVRDFAPPAQPAAALYVVFAGGNDFLQTLDENGFNNNRWTAKVAAAAKNLADAVDALYARGARTILVPNVVDVTVIPLLNQLPGFYRDYLRDKVKDLNAQLASRLAHVAATRADLRLVPVDFYTLVRRLLRNYRAYGFVEEQVDALSDVTLLDKSFDGRGRHYVFWDPVHPSTKSHAIIAQWFYEALVGPQPLAARLVADAGKVNLTFTGAQLGKTYVLQRSADLAAWADVMTIFTAHVPPAAVTLANDQPRAFFRVKLQP